MLVFLQAKQGNWKVLDDYSPNMRRVAVMRAAV